MRNVSTVERIIYKTAGITHVETYLMIYGHDVPGLAMLVMRMLNCALANRRLLTNRKEPASSKSFLPIAGVPRTSQENSRFVP